MSRYYGGWAPYVPVAARRQSAAREMEKLRRTGAVVSPVTIAGRKIATTFWGSAWCDNLESYHDYKNRLPRGRTYVRNGSVVDLQIAPREVTAIVSGSSLYKVKISIGDMVKAHWKSICADCAGGIDSLVELLQGRFSKGVMERICRQGAGLFPKPAEIRFSCSCPDYASMCKHVAAVLYGVGARLDADPALLFRLRGVEPNDLVGTIGDALPMSQRGPDAGKVLETEDVAALFGLDMSDPGETVAPFVSAPVPPADSATSRHRPASPSAEAGRAEAAPAKVQGKMAAASKRPAPAPGQAGTALKSIAPKKTAAATKGVAPKQAGVSVKQAGRGESGPAAKSAVPKHVASKAAVPAPAAARQAAPKTRATERSGKAVAQPAEPQPVAWWQAATPRRGRKPRAA
jgi:uncharacterized Zn finger protein